MPFETEVKIAFRKMWMVGALGVYFTALVRSLLTDVFGVPVWLGQQHRRDLIVRYLYVLWFLTYFFISHVRIDKPPKKRDVPFDVIQASIGFAVAFALGFLDPQQGFSFAHQAYAVIASDVGIIVIAGLAIRWFPKEDLNPVRVVAILVAMVSASAAYISPYDPTTIPVALLALWFLLVRFGSIQMKAKDSASR